MAPVLLFRRMTIDTMIFQCSYTMDEPIEYLLLTKIPSTIFSAFEVMQNIALKCLSDYCVNI